MQCEVVRGGWRGTKWAWCDHEAAVCETQDETCATEERENGPERERYADKPADSVCLISAETKTDVMSGDSIVSRSEELTRPRYV